MRKQQRVWQTEHTTQAAIPALADSTPSSGLIKFLDIIEGRQLLEGRAVDIGCGRGRNSVYLAQRGFEAYGVDYIEEALVGARKLAQTANCPEQTHFIRAEIDKPWGFADNFFDVAVDSFSSIDIETLEGREICRNEMWRTLKPGGYAMVTVVSANDEWEKHLIATSPGPELNSTIWPQNGKFQKDYDETELRQFYKRFKIIDLQEIKRPGAVKLERNFTATNFWLVLQKQ